MCWNQYISINTFVFGVFVLLLVAFNNKYSNYKIEFFNNIYAYLFVLSVISMQFIEFILWRNLKNISINRLFSTFGLLLLTIQPFFSLLMINNNIRLRNTLLAIYTIPTILYLIYNISNTNIHTVSKSGHLYWDWQNSYFSNNFSIPIVLLYYLFFVFYSFIYNKQYVMLIYLLLFIVLKYYYYKDKTASSLWCFYLNTIMLYFLFEILLRKPFNELLKHNRKKCIFY